MTKNFGLQTEFVDFIKKIIKEHLQQKSSFSVDVFGSRARGDFRQYSDLDLWISSSPPMTSTELAKLIEKFESSILPIKVDIVLPETVLEDYRDNILKEKVSWF